MKKLKLPYSSLKYSDLVLKQRIWSAILSLCLSILKGILQESPLSLIFTFLTLLKNFSNYIHVLCLVRIIGVSVEPSFIKLKTSVDEKTRIHSNI